MAENPLNGERAALLDFLARCEQAFTPFAPIDLPEFFSGRIEVVRRLTDEIASPGRQVAIFGERGVGKTSLARLAYFFLGRSEEETYLVSCTKLSTFDTIFGDVLAASGVEVTLDGVESEAQGQGGLNVPGTLFPGFSLSGSRRVKKSFRRISGATHITPRMLLEQFAARDGLMIIDEYDRVQDPETHGRLAELIKAFSDAKSRTKIILVGVAETLSGLIGEHQSLQRSLAQIRLDRMSDDELADIIERGSQHLDVRFAAPISHRIVRLADGFPYFVHLLCRHACKRGASAWFSQKRDKIVTQVEYQLGLQDAIENAEHTLGEQYERAIITTRRKTRMFAQLLGAMALSEDRDVQVQQLAEYLAIISGGERRAPSTFSWHLGELVSPERGAILTKVRDGYYKFTNPLMRPYLRFRLELENCVAAGGQLEFPFMRRRS